MTSSPKPPRAETWISGLEPLAPGENEEPSAFEARIGPYVLLEKLGEGGMGTVWAAEQTEPVRRRVALKIIKPGMDTEQVLHRFATERQALALMDHTGIAKVLDAGTSEAGRPYFVMELVKGIPITTYCDEIHASVRDRLGLFVSVCQAIQHAHQKGIIHRDIKPANVLVCIQDGRPVPKVIDFGVAKALRERVADEPMHTQIGEVIGTIEFMSPEQASALDIDTRADVYALGVLLYVLLAGSTPFEGRKLRSAPLMDRLRMIREEDPPKPSARLRHPEEPLAELARARGTDARSLVREVQGDLDWIVMKALEKDRARRYEAASALARDVERYLQDEPVEASPPSTHYRLGKFLRKHRMGALSAAACFVLLGMGAAVSTWQAVRATRAERNAAAVSEFLQDDLLGQADPANQSGEGRDPDVKVRTLLDRSIRTVGAKFKEQPLTEAAIRLTLGKAYRALGNYPEGERQMERSVELYFAQLGPDHPNTLSSENSLAYLYGAEGKFDQAEPLEEEVVRRMTAQRGATHPETLTSKNTLAQLYRGQEKYDQAELLYLEVVQADIAQLGTDHPNTLRAKSNLAALYRDRERYDKAEPIYQQVLRAQSAELGPGHPDTLISKNGLAVVFKGQGRYDEAEALLREVAQERAVILGSDHPDTLTTKNNLALLYLAQKRYEQAEPLFREVVAGSQLKLGLAHHDTQDRIRHLILCYQQMGKPARAEAWRKELEPARPR
jgi:eukaryotic-like serine/threonine-protein kinase